MRPVLLFPLALSFAATLFFLISDDYGWIGKTFAAGLFGLSLIFVFTPLVHFLVPLLLQLVLCFWYAFDRHING